jgi:hypothetical protein
MRNEFVIRTWKWSVLVWVLVGGMASSAAATQRQGPLPLQELFGLGIVAGDPEGWGITGKLWLDHEVALQPALKLGWNGTGAVQCDILWHNYKMIPSDLDCWPLYIGLGAVVDSLGPAWGLRTVGGLDYLLRDISGDVYAQLVPTCWFSGAGAAVELYGEVGFRFYL